MKIISLIKELSNFNAIGGFTLGHNDLILFFFVLSYRTSFLVVMLMIRESSESSLTLS